MYLYPSNIEDKMGFTRIREMLNDRCLGNLGKKEVQKLTFSSEFEKVQSRLDEVNEFKTILERGDPFPVDHYLDLSEILKLLKVPDASLNGEEFIKILRVCKAMEQVMKFLGKYREAYPVLGLKKEKTKLEKAISREIDHVIDQEGNVKPKVSAELDQIRRKLHSKSRIVDQVFMKIFRHARKNNWLSDEGESIRNGKRVLAIRAQNKRKVNGLTHDESSTGQTFFIEPRETLELNNEIFELKSEEKREELRIRRELTRKLHPYCSRLKEYQDLLGELDLIRAKAKLARDMKAQKPGLYDTPVLGLERAYHPLLLLYHRQSGRETVPQDLYLNREQRILVISGPNAGGKSVCLQMAGLLQMMVQAGMLIPSDSSSKAGIFTSLLIDIGDDQSIENDLSTYSSHLQNMDHITRHSDQNSLFLIDELGAGTDPQLGGPVAESVLDFLNKRKALGVVTTHYSNLKIFASHTEGLENGAMVFDRENFRPTFRLESGKPGSSFAFDIARGAGIKEEILKEAENKAGEKYSELDRLLGQLNEEKKKLEKKQNAVNEQQKNLKEQQAYYQQLSEELKQKKKDILLEAREQSYKQISDLNQWFEIMVRKWRESGKTEGEQYRKKINRELKQAKEQLQGELSEIKKKAKEPEKKSEINRGDQVRMKGGQQVGKVVEIRKDKAIVNFGNLKTEVSKTELEHDSALEKSEEKTRKNVDWQQYEQEFIATLDLRGFSADEAVGEMEKWLDTALLLGKTELRLLHGKGNGVLRKVLRNKLKELDFVKDIRSELPKFGGDGITLLELEK